MGMKNWLFFLVLLVSLPIALADWDEQFVCGPDENCTISVFVVLENDVHNLTNTSYCYLHVYHPNGTELLSGGMMTQNMATTGLYYYNISYPDLGHYPAYVVCDNDVFHNNTAVSIMSSGNSKDATWVDEASGDTRDVSFEIVQDTGSWSLAVLLPILAIIGVLAYLSIRMRQLHYFIKVLLFLGSLSLTIVATNIGRIIVEESSPASTGLITLLNTASFVLIILLIVVTAYLIIYYIAELLWGIANTKFGKTP